MIEVLEDNRKMWPALLGKVKGGFLGHKGSAVIQEENTERAFQAKGAVGVRVYKKPDVFRTLKYDWNTEYIFIKEIRPLKKLARLSPTCQHSCSLPSRGLQPFSTQHSRQPLTWCSHSQCVCPVLMSANSFCRPAAAHGGRKGVSSQKHPGTGFEIRFHFEPSNFFMGIHHVYCDLQFTYMLLYMCMCKVLYSKKSRE